LHQTLFKTSATFTLTEHYNLASQHKACSKKEGEVDFELCKSEWAEEETKYPAVPEGKSTGVDTSLIETEYCACIDGRSKYLSVHVIRYFKNSLLVLQTYLSTFIS
jgi:hypothetical protein